MGWTITNRLRRRQRYHELKYRVFEIIGGECEVCGNYYELTVDHVNGRNYVSRKINSVTRVKRYLQEAKKGLLRPLCKECNSRFKPSKSEVSTKRHKARKYNESSPSA